MSVHEAIADFLAFMRSEGVDPVDTGGFIAGITSGEVVRFDCAGDRPKSKNGWAKLYLDERPAGAFGNWRFGINRRWSSGTANELSPDERRALRTEWEQKKADRDQIKRESEEQATNDAAGIWERARRNPAEHPYVERKRIDPRPLRIDGDKLCIPMFDADGRIWNLQRIAPDGAKRFLFGARVDGLFALIGSFAGAEAAVLGEGYATLDSVHQASGLPCIVAFNTANLPKVARIWAACRPDLQYIVFADNDESTAQKLLAERGIYKNPGVEAAQATAEEIGAKIAFPFGRAA